MTVTFCGHGKIYYDESVRQELIKTAETLINDGADTFLLGGYGQFDGLCASILTGLKEKYPYIKIIPVIPYLNRDYYMKDYDESLYPPLENVPRKFCISRRNQWMVEKSDVLVCYIQNTFGGAYNTYCHAKRKNKKIINLYEKL